MKQYLIAGFIGKAKDLKIGNLIVKGTVKMQEVKRKK